MRYLVKLNFISGVHLGADYAGFGREDVLPAAHSDTIFSALLNTMAQMRAVFSARPWFEEILGKDAIPEQQQLPFINSSFCFLDESAQKLYLPRPLTEPEGNIESADPTLYKKFKRLRYISHEWFLKWQAGEAIAFEQMIAAQRTSFWTEDSRMQHRTDSITAATELYRTGVIFYDDDVRPCFFVDIDEDHLSLEEFKEVLLTLSFNGLGGRRSTGLGQFKFEPDDLIPLDVDDSDHFITDISKLFTNSGEKSYLLSTYFPSQNPKKHALAYELVLRKGWFYSASSYSQMKRKTCYMFGEGSIFTGILSGKLVDVTPASFTEHKIYRCGIPFVLPFA